jgi:serine/threonine protein kinase
MQLDGLEIGRYRFARLLGSGGMGDVYLAEDAQIGQQVAIKVIRAEGSLYPTAQAGQEAARLFRREAQAAARLDHPHILPLFDYGEARVGGMTLLYLVMPYRPEGSLASWVREHSPEKLLPPVVAHFIRQAAEALQHAHNRQIIHQDVKAANFLLRRREEAPERPDLLLADFGIARVAATAASVSQVVRGSPSAMAPEQWQGEPVPATDQYALAVMAYELLTGRSPFQGTMMRLMHDHLYATPPAPSTFNPLLPKEIDTVLLHALAKEPGQRFSSMSAFANAFEQAAQRAVPTPAGWETGATPPPFSAPAAPEAGATAPTPPSATTMPRVHGSSGIYTVPTRTSTPPPEDTAAAPTRLPSQAPESIFNAPTRSSDQVPENIYQAPTRVSHRQAETIPAVSTRTSNQLPETVGVARKTATPVDPPTAATSPARSIAGSARQRLLKGRKRKIALAALLVLLLLVGGTLGYVAAFGITLKDTYTITTVPDETNVEQHQVHSEAIYLQTPTYTQTVPATGPAEPATQARGVLDLSSDVRAPVILHQGLVLDPNDTSGTCVTPIQMVLDADVTIPASPNGVYGEHAQVPAHTLQYGAIANIPAFPNSGCFSHFTADGSGTFWQATSSRPFTGGQDAGPTVQQSDIDGAARSLMKTHPAPDARGFLATSGELLARPAPSCQPKIMSNDAVGDRVDQVAVHLFYGCTGYGYDASGAAQVATGLLIDHYGAHLTLRGKITTAVTSAVLLDRQPGTIRLTVTAEGTWSF